MKHRKHKKFLSVFCSILAILPGSLWINPNNSKADSPQNYLINDTFEDASLPTTATAQQTDSLDGYSVSISSNTSSWTFNPSHNYAQIISDPANGSNKVLNVYDSEDGNNGKGSTKISKSFTPQTGLVDAELNFFDNDSSVASNNRVLDLISSDGKTIVDLETYKINNTPVIAMRQADGTYTPILPSVKPGQWYHVKVQVDLVNKKVDTYITDSSNQTSSLLQQRFYQSATNAGTIMMQTPNSSAANLDFDNVQVYAPSTPPVVPTGLTAAVGNTQVGLTWSAASGATAYNIYRSTQSGGPYTLVQGNVTGLSYDDTGLTNNTTYYYVISGVNLNGESDKSSEISVTPNDSVPLPASPSNVKAVSRDSEVSISWDPVPGSAKYILQRSTKSGGPYTTVSSTLTDTSYLDRTVSDNTTYYYVISAKSVAGTGPISSEVSATPVTPFAAPTGLNANPGDSKVDISWNSVASASSYNVKRSTTSGGPYQTIATGVSGTSYSDTSAANGTIYYYVITAVNSSTESMISDQVKAIPNASVPGAPATPKGIQATAGDGQVHFSWNAVDGADTYTVKRSQTSGGPYSPVVVNLRSTSFTDSSVTNGTTYYYVVSASNPKGESVNSDESIVVPGKVIVVAQDGSGDFTTIKDALVSIPANNTARTVIYLKAGTYHEKLNVTSPNVSFVGEGRDVTTIVNGDYGGTDGQSGNVGGTFNTYTVQASADGFTASNLTIQNSAYPRGTVGTAVALAVKSDQAVFDNIKLLGYQDTLYTGLNSSSKGRQYYHNSIIEGDVDFIFGEAPAVVFDHDEIITMGAPGTNGGGHVTAAAQLNKTDPGYVFLNSRIEKDPSAFGSYDLGRPWKNNPSVRFINTWMDSQIIPAGWTSWNVTPAFYGEYNSTGPGANPSSRLMSMQMTADEASEFTIPRIFGGWDPSIPETLPSINQIETAVTPTINPGSITFDKNPSHQEDVSVTVQTNGDALTNITNGAYTLDPSTDTTVNGNVYTLSKEYLAKQSDGTLNLQVNFESGIGLLLPVTINDSRLTESPTTAPITSIEPVNLVTTAGVAPVMPTLVMAGYGDQSTLALDVSWDSVDSSKYAAPGSYTVTGTVKGTEIPAVANITVKPSSKTAGGQDVQSYLTNLPFEAPNVTVAQFQDRDFNIKDYGAVGDGFTKNTDAFAQAIAACNQAGGGRVDVPAGIWLTGPIQLKSNVNLHLEKGAEILFSSDYNDYLSGSSYQYLLSSNGANNVAITGNGVINGQGQYWRPVKQSKMTTQQWNNLLASGGVVNSDGQWYPSKTMVGAKRPYMIDLRHSSNILIDGPKLENSPMFTLSINNDQNVVIRNTTINEPWWAQNGDGMDITSSQNLVIYHNTVNAGDDGIAMKSSGSPSATTATSNVVVSDNIVFHAHGGFVVGSNTGGGINNIMVRNNQYIDTDAGIKLKTYVGNGGPIENIYIDNINMQNIDTDAIHFDTYYNGDNAASQNAQPGDPSVVPEYKNIHISNITADGAAQAVYIEALPHVPLHDVDLTNITIHASQGFVSTNATNVTLKNVNITADSGPVYTLNNSTNFVFDHIPCPAGMDTFLHLEGSSNGIELLDTNTSQAKVPYVLDSGISQDAIKVVDDESPVTSAQVSPSTPDGQNNWYVHPVTVNLSATDNLSGVDSSYYSINGGAWQKYNGPISINDDGIYHVAYYSTDRAGNLETSKYLNFQIDQTGPTVTYSGNAGVYTVDQNVAIKCTANDNLSGVASSSCADITGPAYSFNLGTNTFAAKATDQAGNLGNGSTEFTVKVTFDSLINLTEQLVKDSEVANSLTSKLDAAKQSNVRGNSNAMDGQLDSYRNEVSAQTGKALTNEQANLLSQFAIVLK